MTQAERIREFVLASYVAPARASGCTEVIVRVGDVHRDMGFKNAMPAVCSAIGGRKFEAFAGVTLLDQQGPHNGANVFFRFHLTADGAPKERPVQERPLRSASSHPKPVAEALELASSLALVSRVKTKLPHPAPARSLYISPLFTKTRDLVESVGGRWFVLSSAYGLISPEAEIEPYDYTLNSAGIAERRRWAKEVLTKLIPEIRHERRIVMFAGARYREFLIEPLERLGLTVVVPMAHLTRGEQLGWLTENG